MSNGATDNVKSHKHWWLYLLVGILFIGMGIWVIATPVEGFIALSYAFAIIFIVSGISTFVFAIKTRATHPTYGWTVALGIVQTLLGLILLFNIELSMFTLAFYVGFMLMMNGMNSIALSYRLQKSGNKSWGWSLALGIIAFFLSFMVLFNPLLGAWTSIIMVATAFLVSGFSLCFLAFQLKKGLISEEDLEKSIEDLGFSVTATADADVQEEYANDETDSGKQTDEVDTDKDVENNDTNDTEIDEDDAE
jgi:uncharacterized membrane protein HdeD (DUF308 family)